MEFTQQEPKSLLTSKNSMFNLNKQNIVTINVAVNNLINDMINIKENTLE